MALQEDCGIFIASSLIADTPEKDKENEEPTGDTPVTGRTGRRSGEGRPRSGRKSLLGRRRSSVGRRLSGFGGGGFDVNADQARGYGKCSQSKMMSMYRSTIKLSSENKITKEKCWGLHLIDYMDKVIMDEGGQTGGPKVNFQKASCTLDASVKIYSHRVDATHTSSYSLLENLNRTDHDKPERGGGGAAVGSSERSARLGVHETLKKPDQLNQSETDREFRTDPMFHKMSKIFDEAGSKGMLLNNLSVSNGCKVSFDSESSTAPPSPEGAEGAPRTIFRRPDDDADEDEASSDEETAEMTKEKEEAAAAAAAAAAAKTAAKGMTDITGLRSTLFSICGDLAALPLCPQLQEFRDQIAEAEDTPKERPVTFGVRGNGGGEAAGGGDANCDDSDSDGGGGEGFDDDAPGADAGSFGGGGGGGGDFGGAGDHAADVADADPFQADSGDGFAGGGGGGMSFLDDGGDGGEGGGGVGFDADGVGVDDEGVPTEAGGGMGGAQASILEDRFCIDMKIVNDDYAFYDAGALAAAAARSRSNIWAGASHWKFAGVKKKRPVPNDPGASGAANGGEDGGVLETGGGRKPRGKKKAALIDFADAAVPESAVETPAEAKAKGRRRGTKDATLLSEDYVRRAWRTAEEATSNSNENYALPENAGFKTKDLAEMFLVKSAFTRAWNGGVGGGVSETGGRADHDGFHDSVTGGGGDDDLLFKDANDGYGPGGGDFDDDDDGGSEGFHFADGGFDAAGAGEEEGGGGGGEGLVLDADGVFVDDFEGQGLLSAGRRVEKISVNYARKAKRVDVRRLKGDLWHKINAEFQSDNAAAAMRVDGGDDPKVENDAGMDQKAKNEEDSGDGSAEAAKGEEEEAADAKPSTPEVVDMTFSDIVHDVASREEQSGVTVPFYFICLLHLANEKGLRLEGQEDLLDFSVASDPVTGTRGIHTYIPKTAVCVSPTPPPPLRADLSWGVFFFSCGREGGRDMSCEVYDVRVFKVDCEILSFFVLKCSSSSADFCYKNDARITVELLPASLRVDGSMLRHTLRSCGRAHRENP
ncbi:unnamed protein product [Pylaiella littoralis]